MADNKTVYCEKCGGVIKNSYELVVTTDALRVKSRVYQLCLLEMSQLMELQVI